MTLSPESYRSSSEFREILRILQKASTLQENLLWQSLPESKNIVPIHHFEIDFVSREVVAYYNSQKSSVATGHPLYIKLDYRTSIFKITEFRQASGSVHFSFPKEIKTRELRVNPRHLIKPTEQSYISLKSSFGGQGLDANAGLQVRMVDASEFGVGLIVSEQNRSFLKNNRILWITQIEDRPIESPLLAEVVYMNNEIEPAYRSSKKKELKVGLKLSEPFPSDLLSKIKKT